MTEREVQQSDEQLRYSRLEEAERRDLLAGLATEVDTAPTDAVALERFASKLEGYRKNATQQEAWVSGLKLPPAGEPAPGEVVEVEFLLPSGDTFSHEFEVPPKTWPEDNEFVQFLELLGRLPATLPQMLGDAVPVRHTGTEWELALTQEIDSADGEPESSQPPKTVINSLVFILLFLIVMSQFLLPVLLLATVPGFLTFLPLLLGGVATVVTVVCVGLMVFG